MPRYQIAATYSSPSELSPEQHRAVSASTEAAAVASLRIATGVGRVPAPVRDALAILRAWYGAEALGLPVMIAAGMEPNTLGVVGAEGEPLGIITNVGD